MPGGTDTKTSPLQITNIGSADRAVGRLAEQVRDTQTDLTRNGRLLLGPYQIAAGAALDVAHGLGHRHTFVLLSPRTLGATDVYEYREGTPAALVNTHVHLLNGGALAATFALWVV